MLKTTLLLILAAFIMLASTAPTPTYIYPSTAKYVYKTPRPTPTYIYPSTASRETEPLVYGSSTPHYTYPPTSPYVYRAPKSTPRFEWPSTKRHRSGERESHEE